MEIVVLIKRVPDTASLIQINADGNGIQEENLKWVLNPYDEIAVEEAIQLRDAHGGKVTVMSVGPKKTEEIILTSLAMGADEGIRIDDSDLPTSDSLSTAKVLAAALGRLSYDLILCGMRGVDYDHYQTGAAVAELLKIPQVTQIINLEVGDGKLTCQQMIEGGSVEIETDLPALLTAQRGLNVPRYASLPGIMKAKKKPIHVKTLEEIGLKPGDVAPKSKMVTISLPAQREAAQMIDGDSDGQKAAALAKILHEDIKAI